MTSLILILSRLFRFCPATGGSRADYPVVRRCLSWVTALSMVLALAPGGAWAQTTPIIFSPTTLPNAVVSAGVYNQTITASGGTGSKTFAVTSGSLPPGLTLSPAGVLSGVPTTGGTFNFLVTATDQAGATASWAYSFTVIGPPNLTDPTATSVGATTATLGGTITGNGGAAILSRGVVYSLTATNPNPQIGGPGVTAVTGTSGTTGGFAVNVTGLVQGATYSYKAYATNTTGAGYTPVGTFTTTIITIAPTLLPNATGNVPYDRVITATGGTAPYTFTITGGVLPPGLTLTPAGFLTGTPTTGGVYTFSITVTDAAGASRSQPYGLLVTPPVVITTRVLPDSALNLAGYFFTIDATGGTGAKTYEVTEGSIPFGLVLDPASGTISGTPNSPGTFTFTVRVVDTSGAQASRTYTIVIGGPVTITTSTLSGGSVNQTNYSETINASGGTGLKTFTVSSGTLPPGLNLSSDGILSGTPTTAGTYNFSVAARDLFGETVNRSFSIVINPALAITTASLPDLPLALGYNQTIASTGGTGTATFAVTAGALPTGLTLSPEGILSGTAETAGTFNFTITVTDAAGATASQAYSVVAGGPIAIGPATLTNPVINVSGYTATLTAGGGSGARTFAVTSGSLPPGLTLSSAGVLSGTATSAGTFNFTVTATDATGATGERAYSLVVAPPVMVAQTITFGALPNRLASDGPFVLSATASSGLPVTFVVTGPAVLNGSTVTLTGVPGVVTVTASQPGNGSFLAAPTIVQSFTVTVADRLINLSSRVRIAPDATRSLIAGFVIGGTQAKRVLLRAIGPGLTGFGVTGALVNPRLQVFNSAGVVVLENDDWTGSDTAAAFTQVSAFALAAGSRDAALLATLSPGSYTMQITAGTETGIALAEVYDASPNPGAETQRLVNISTRGNVEPGDGVLIGGFVISGSTAKRVLIRGIGPSLGTFGVGGTLADPRLAVFSGTTVIAQNDDWSVPTPLTPQQPAASAAEITSVAQNVGAFGLSAGSRDAAVLVTLAPGAYTAQVAGAGTTSGVALVEIYEVP